VLEVTRAGYYKWLDRQENAPPTQVRREALLERVMGIFVESNETYGAPRIYQQLRKEGFTCSRRTVEELMRKHEITPKRKRKFVATTDSKHDLPIAPNVLDRQFQVDCLDEVWVSDITYIDTNQGWLYLCVFIDLYSRLVVGWSMSERMTADLVVSAFEMGVDNQGNAPIVAHSDRGSQYASDLYRKLLDDYGCIQSMSRKGNCWDNAVAESFFGSLKSERIYRDHYETRIHACMTVFEYIEIFYNKTRLHSVLDYLTPWEKGQKGRKVA
jgi:putative transposase